MRVNLTSEDLAKGQLVDPSGVASDMGPWLDQEEIANLVKQLDAEAGG